MEMFLLTPHLARMMTFRHFECIGLQYKDIISYSCQKMAFCNAKGHLLHGERPSPAFQNAVFYLCMFVLPPFFYEAVAVSVEQLFKVGNLFFQFLAYVGVGYKHAVG